MAWRNDRLKEVRLERGMTIEVLSKLADVHIRTLNYYEAGNTEPTANVLRRLAQSLGVSADYLLGLSDDRGSGYVQRDLTPDEQEIIEALRTKQTVRFMRQAAAILESGN